MTEFTALSVILAGSIGAWAAWDLTRAARVWRRFRGPRVVTCPETGRAAAVRIDLTYAVTTALLEHEAAVRLAECSRWSTRGHCDQPCAGAARSRESTPLAVADRFFAGHVCTHCGRSIGDVQFMNHHAALLAPDGTTVEWSDVPPEHLPAALLDGRPVCWNCHVAETFRRTRPDLVTDRPSRASETSALRRGGGHARDHAHSLSD